MVVKIIIENILIYFAHNRAIAASVCLSILVDLGVHL